MLQRIAHWLYSHLLPRAARIKLNEWRTRVRLEVLKRPRGRISPPRQEDYLSEHHGTLIEGHLGVRVLRGGVVIEQRDLGKDRFTDAGPNTVVDGGVAAMVNDWFDGSKDITAFNFHAMGTGGSPPGTPAVTVSTLVTEVESRAAGSKSKPAANQIRTVATITATAPRTVNEWGLFDAASGPTLWSTRWFTAIALATSDAVEFTYTLTISSFTA